MPRTITYANAMARGHYEITAAPGRYSHADFRPQLTPPEMLRLGVFGGRYLNSCRDEYPSSWWRGVRLSDDHARPDLNRHLVLAGQPLTRWRANGWIREHDPRGWFEWFARYYRGRRIPGYDEWQIARHNNYVPRHLAQARRNPTPRHLQALLQWGVDTESLT